MREARDAGAAVVIVVVHSGLNEPSSYDTVSAPSRASENVAARLAHEVPGIDLIVYGHSHKEMADTVIGGTLLMQPQELGDERRDRAPRLDAARRTVARRVAKRSQIVPVAAPPREPGRCSR